VEPDDRRVDPEPGPEPRSDLDRGTSDPPYHRSDAEVVSRFSPARRAFELVYLILAVICALLIIRIVLKLLAANTAVTFTGFVYGSTNLLMGPFNGMFPVYAAGRTVFEGSAVIALLVYSVLGYVLARLASIMFRRDVTVPHGSRDRYRAY
jgi:hypothetical protein